MIKRIIYFILFTFFLFDLGYSFVQHFSQSLDGDMASVIVPSDDFIELHENPFGLKVLNEKQPYPSPNRFFCHWSMKEYFRTVPLLFQNFLQPINSVYLSSAFIKTLIQLLLIVSISIAIIGNFKWYKLDFMIVAVLISPLFQTNGYRSYMGVIDPSITYTFFYALPFVILLLYLLPFILQYYHKKKIGSQIFIKILYIPVAFVICLSGPLNPGIILIFSGLVVVNRLMTNYLEVKQTEITRKSIFAIIRMPKNYWFYLFPVSLLSLYSLYIGSYNSSNVIIPLTDLYFKIINGVYFQFTQKLGFPILFLILSINTIIISKTFKTDEGKKILAIFKWILIFALVYIILLPFGGYRDYRPNIVRYDTIMPITLGLIFLFGSTSFFIIKTMSSKQKVWYIPIIVLVLFIYTFADTPEFDNNKCEKLALKEISESKDSIIELSNNCNILSWEIIYKSKDSEFNMRLLKIWGIVREEKLYFNK